MTPDDVRQLIGRGENLQVEFKRDDLRPEQLAREMVGLLNVEGGHILIGVEDDGSITGTQRPDLDQWVINISRDCIDPPVIPALEFVDTGDGRKVCVITLPTDAADKPYKARHGGHAIIVVRVGATCRDASREEEERLYHGEPLVPSQALESSGGAPAEFENPYDFNKPAKKYFRGRDAEFQKLVAWAREGKSAVVWGLQRIGKTSLVEKVLEEVGGTPARDRKIVPLRLNMFESQEFFNTDHDLLFNLTDLFASQMGGNPERARATFREILQTAQTHDLYKKFRSILEQGAERTKSSLLLFIDEFQDISKAFERAQLRKTPNPISAGLIRYLGSLLKDGVLQLIICCRYKGLPLDRRLDLQLFKLLNELDLGPLDEVSARLLIRDPVSSRIKYEDQSAKRIVELTGNNPYLIQYLCSELVMRPRVKRAQLVKRRDVDECGDDIVADPIREAKFNVLYEDFQDIDGGLPWKVLLSLAHQAANAMQFVGREETFRACRGRFGLRCEDNVLMHAIDRLVQARIVAEENRGPVPSYMIRADLLRAWLRNRRYFEKAS